MPVTMIAQRKGQCRVGWAATVSRSSGQVGASLKGGFESRLKEMRQMFGRRKQQVNTLGWGRSLAWSSSMEETIVAGPGASGQR